MPVVTLWRIGIPAVDERLPDGHSRRVVGVGTEVEQDPHRDASLPPLDDLARVTPIGHEPVRDIDSGLLVPDHLEDCGAAVLEGVVAEPVGRRHLRRGWRRRRQDQSERCHRDSAAEQPWGAISELGDHVQGPFVRCERFCAPQYYLLQVITFERRRANAADRKFFVKSFWQSLCLFAASKSGDIFRVSGRDDTTAILWEMALAFWIVPPEEA